MDSSRFVIRNSGETSDLGESLRDVEQIRQRIDTLQKETGDRTYRSHAQEANFRIVTPIYKIGEKPGTEISTGASGGRTTHLNGDYKADYRAEKSQEQYRMQIIDPKVTSHAHIPAHAGSLPHYGKKLADDFPSEHGKRSLLKLDPLEQRKLKSVESRPVTTSNYLTESVERHRKMEASELEKYLKAREGDVNKPWNKPGWPGPKAPDDARLRELEQIRKTIDNLQKAASEIPKHDDLDELARISKELAERSKNRPDNYRLVGSQIIKTEPEPLPAHFKEQIREMLESRISTETSDTALQQDRSGYVTDDKFKRGIIKRKELDSREQMIEPARREYQVAEVVQHKPKVTQNIERKEEVRRTEEVERRVIRRERRQKSSRQRHGYGYAGQEAVDWYGGSGGQYRSNSSHRGHNGYHLPAYETYYHRSNSTKRGGDRDFEDRGLAHARYGSLSDSLRRGELKYVPNGEVREKGSRMHKSHSTRDVFHDGSGGYDSFSNFRRGSEARGAPLVEYPPTLPRSERSGPPIPPHHGSDSFYRPISKSRSYADWDEGRGPFGNSVKRYDDDMARLENEFRDSLLMPVNGNSNEKDYRHEVIPGGYETYNRESKANAGRRLNREGMPTDFKEGSQEYSFKREVQR